MVIKNDIKFGSVVDWHTANDYNIEGPSENISCSVRKFPQCF